MENTRNGNYMAAKYTGLFIIQKKKKKQNYFKPHSYQKLIFL